MYIIVYEFSHRFIISVILILCLMPYGIKQTQKSKAVDYGISNPRIEKDGTVTIREESRFTTALLSL